MIELLHLWSQTQSQEIDFNTLSLFLQLIEISQDQDLELLFKSLINLFEAQVQQGDRKETLEDLS